MDLGGSEIFLILIVVLLLFGGKRLPELARSLGRGLAEFRRATQAVQREINTPLNDPLPTAQPNSPSKETSDGEPIKTEVHANPAAQPRASESPPGSDSGRS